jgi:hypothetical protein
VKPITPQNSQRLDEPYGSLAQNDHLTTHFLSTTLDMTDVAARLAVQPSGKLLTRYDKACAHRTTHYSLITKNMSSQATKRVTYMCASGHLWPRDLHCTESKDLKNKKTGWNGQSK